MIPELSLDNFWAWIAQAFIIVSLGALLPTVFRLRDPKSQIVYYHALLILCVILPLIQPLASVAPARGAAAPFTPVAEAVVTEPLPPGIPWPRLLLYTLLAGAALRLGWLGAGLWRLRRHRLDSRLLGPTPDSIRRAERLTGARAEIRIAADGTGPVTFGFRRPVVLLPPSFLSMNAEEQCAIACHELLHVRRRDWLLTFVEEIYGALFWFHPVVWWMLARTRLAREQVVDREVVHLTRGREGYVRALLRFAADRPGLSPGPAPLFLGRRHLSARLRALLTEVSMSRSRLIVSYAAMAAILAGGGWLTLAAFPLAAAAETAAPQAGGRTGGGNPGFVVSRPAMFYPPEARGSGVEGQVVVGLTFNNEGAIVDSRVLSGPDVLRRAALQTALQNDYGIDYARTLQVIVEFQAPRPVLRGQLVVPPTSSTEELIRLDSNIAADRRIAQTPPIYPPLAREVRIQGVVIIDVMVGVDGTVQKLQVISGHALLQQAAVDAVRQWRYQPYLQNGQPVPFSTRVTVNFTLN